MSDLFTAYRTGDQRIDHWFGGPWDLQAIAEHAPQSLAPGLAEQWNTALSAYDADASARQGLQDLASGRAIAIVTGQQPAFGGGPLYTLAKTAHAVALAQRLSASGTPAVPVFWCASEDHDHGEADHADLIARDGRLQRVHMPWATPGAASRFQPAARGWQTLCDAARDHVPGQLGAAWLQEHAPHADEGLGAWTCRLLQGLFAGQGLLCLEPHLLRPYWHQRAARWQREWPLVALAERHHAVRELFGIDPLGHLASPPWFADRPTGRIAIDDPSLAGPALSTGAALRPLVQQVVLDAAAYVGGPGEITYHAQLGPLFAAFAGSSPRLVPRVSIELLPSWWRRGLEAWNADSAHVRATATTPATGQDSTAVDIASRLRAALDDCLPRTDDTDTARRLEAGRRRIAHEIDRLQASLQRGERQRAAKPPWGALHAWLHPREAPQDRVLSLFQAVYSYGPGIARTITEAIDAAGETTEPILIAC